MSRKRPCTLTLNIKEGPELLKDIQNTAQGLKMPISRLLIGLFTGTVRLHEKALESKPDALQPIIHEVPKP